MSLVPMVSQFVLSTAIFQINYESLNRFHSTSILASSLSSIKIKQPNRRWVIGARKERERENKTIEKNDKRRDKDRSRRHNSRVKLTRTWVVAPVSPMIIRDNVFECIVITCKEEEEKNQILIARNKKLFFVPVLKSVRDEKNKTIFFWAPISSSQVRMNKRIKWFRSFYIENK